MTREKNDESDNTVVRGAVSGQVTRVIFRVKDWDQGGSEPGNPLRQPFGKRNEIECLYLRGFLEALRIFLCGFQF